MSHGPSSGGGVEVNLIPMIDIVIQLITFFLMLVNFDNSNKDERIRLPIADLAKPSEMDIDEPLTLSINGRGEVNTGLGDLVDADGDSFRATMIREAHEAKKRMKAAGKLTKEDPSGRTPLWTTVMIRGDKDTDYGKVQRMMKICQEQGFYKFALRASPDGKGQK